MKLLLDEMWSPIGRAVLNVQRQPAHRVRSGAPDIVIFATAQAETRAIVTENVRDFRLPTTQYAGEGRVHAGVIFSHNRVLPRSDAGVSGRVVSSTLLSC